jgi:xylan 1,4-beta-xylosidase
LYQHAAKAIKAVDAGLQVGGPATAENAWVTEFREYCEKNEVPFDFISTHHYPTDAFGKPGDDTVAQLAASRRSVLRGEMTETKKKAGDKPVYYTEWSTSSNPFDTLHDQPYAAAFITKTIMEARGLVKGYSYWTFSDIFDENYFSSIPFHGGFGLLNVYGIPKPAYRAYVLLHQLGEDILPVEGQHATVDVWVIKSKDVVQVLLTNSALPRHEVKTELIRIKINNLLVVKDVSVQRIDDTHANAYATWIEMGRPGTLQPAQVDILEAASALVKEPHLFTWENNSLFLEIELLPQATALVTIEAE